MLNRCIMFKPYELCHPISSGYWARPVFVRNGARASIALVIPIAAFRFRRMRLCAGQAQFKILRLSGAKPRPCDDYEHRVSCI